MRTTCEGQFDADEGLCVNRRNRIFFALVGGPPVALALGAAMLLFGAMSGRHLMWQPTDADLVSAIRNQNPVAVKVFVEALPSVDTPVPFAHPRILNFRQLKLAPLAIALLQDHDFIVQTLLRAGSDPATALGQMSSETASALLEYASEMQNALAIEYLTKYRIDRARATAVDPMPAAR
jgi:hypothetical protein